MEPETILPTPKISIFPKSKYKKNDLAAGILERYNPENKQLQRLGTAFFKRGKTANFLKIQVGAEFSCKPGEYLMLFPQYMETILVTKKGTFRGL